MDSVQDTRRKNWGWFYYDLVDQWGETIKADGLAVMMVLIRHADNDTHDCYPSTATIAQKTGLSRRYVVTVLQRLAGHGLITITPRVITSAAGNTIPQSNLYTLLPLPSAPDAVPVMQGVHRDMNPVHIPTAPDAVPPMQDVHTRTAQPAPEQDLINYTQKNKTQLTSDPAPAPRGTSVKGQKGAPPVDPNLPLPKSYPLTDEMRAWVAMEVPELGERVDQQHKLFCNHYHGKGTERRTNWRPVWESWMFRAVSQFPDRTPNVTALTVTGGSTNGRPTHADREAARLRANLAFIAS